MVGECKTPVCSSFTYSAPVAIPAFTQASVEDSIGGVTPDARTLLYVKTVGSACGSYHLIVADETVAGSGIYGQMDASSIFTTHGLFVGQEAYAITADGLSIITVKTNRKQIVSTKRSAVAMIDFASPSTADFDAINATITATDAGQFFSPVISADGLEFVYTVVGYTGPDATKNGIYDSVRASTSVPFPAGTLMPSPVNSGEAGVGSATGISSDRLALFVFFSYSSRIFTRRSTSQPFSNPNAPAAPPLVGGWSHKPLADCTKLVGMTSPGGCQNEDVVQNTRQ